MRGDGRTRLKGAVRAIVQVFGLRTARKLALILALLVSALAVAAPAIAGPPPLRGEMVDIGGRRLHLICQGPRSNKPLVVLEGGIWSFSAGWDAVQKRLAEAGLRSCAYDRAGVGYSDPGPEPRDGDAIVADLEALLTTKGEAGPYVLVGHSMAGLYTRLFALRHPDKVVGLVLVDATSPQLAAGKWGRAFLKSYKTYGATIDFLSWARILPLATHWFADTTGVDPEAHRELVYFFPQRAHQHWGARETEQAYEAARETLAAGRLDPDLPVVAIIRAHDEGAKSPWGRARYDAASASRRGAVVSVDRSSHASLIGRDHAAVVAKAVLSVLDLAAAPPDRAEPAHSGSP